jgi:hypothetical protein
MQEETIRNIKKMLRLRMNGEVSAFMRLKGLEYKINFGLDAMSIREIAERFSPDETLAIKLWQESSRECKILATLLYPKQAFSSELADEWQDSCFTTELSEQLCFNLLQHLEFASDKAIEWILSDNPERKSAGYHLLLRLILSKKKLPNLSEVLILAETDKNLCNFTVSQNAERFLEYAQMSTKS